MRTRDVKSWVTSSTNEPQSQPYDSDDDLAPFKMNADPHGDVGSSVDPLQQWDDFVQLADRSINSSSTKVRIDFLQRQGRKAAKLVELESAKRVELLALLLATYVKYIDRDSRLASLQLAHDLISIDEATATGLSPSSSASAATNDPASSNVNGPVIKYAVGWLKREAERICRQGTAGGIASPLAARAALHAWICKVFAVTCQTANARPDPKPESLPVWEPLVQLLALTYDSILSDGQGKSAVRRNVVNLTRRTLRSCQTQIPALIASLTASPSGAAALRAVPLLGEVVAVSVRLRVGSESSKGASDGVGRNYVASAKATILGFYSTQVVASKTAVPSQALTALADFIATEVTEDDVSNTLRPQLEKMLLRSPEIALPVASGLFEAYQGDAGPHAKALLNSIVSASRSSNAVTRSKALDLFQVLSRKTTDKAALSNVVDEILAVLKGGKAATPEARASLFAMLHHVEAGETTKSVAIVDVVSNMLAKEVQEASMQAGIRAVCRHLGWCLQQDRAPAAAAVSSALNKELQNAKVPLRKAVCTAVGQLFWDLPDGSASAASKAFAESLLPGLEANLKASSTNMLTAPGGPLEGYVAVAIIEGKLSGWGSAKVAAVLEKNAVLQAITATSPKPSFVLSEKVIKKLATEEEELWLLRALQALIKRRSAEFERNETLRISAALGFIHVLLHGSSASSRRSATAIVEAIAADQPLLINSMVREGAFAYLQQPSKDAATVSAAPASRATSGAATGVGSAAAAAATVAEAADDAAASSKNYGRDLRRLLQAATGFPEEVDIDARQRALVGMLVLAHHPELLDHGTTCFMDLCFRAKVLPIDLVTAKLQDLLASIRTAIEAPGLAEAGYASMTTLARMSPDEVMAELVSLVEVDIQCDEIARLSQEELGIWRTEPGTLFVDVLSAKKEPTNERSKKDSSIEQWEAEIREQIAKKKAAASKTLTKDQKAAVDAQAKVENETRSRIEELRSRLVRSLKTISSLVGSRADELQGYMQSLVNLTIDVIRVPQAKLLVGEEVRDAFWALSSCTSTRLDIYSMFTGVAILRTIDDELVAEDLRREPINELVLRILYRLRTLSEQAPLDAGSVAFINPLIVAIVQAGGLGVKSDDTDSVLEQIQLALDFITFHISACEDVRYPRSSFVDSLVHIVAKHSQIAKDAVASLRDLGEAIRTSTLPHELQKLLGNTMVDEVYVRNGCLQALQPLDLTDLEFPVELWLACHDEDENNARLAEKAWEENALDVPVDFAPILVPLLEHRNVYVRQSCARALAEATRLHPEQVSPVIAQLCALYRERNRTLAPEYDRFGMVIDETKNREDPWKPRAAVANALKFQAEFFQGTDVAPFFDFLIAGQALGDRNDDVREKMLDAASTVIDLHGGDHISELISMFEAFFAHPASTSDENDGVTEAVVILLGREARHLSPTDSRISKVVDRLIDALKTPSELVQSAVADCLPPLVQAISKDVPRLFDSLFDQLFRGAKYAERRGAAYGLAGLVMGRGIGSIKEFRVMSRLSSAVSEKSATTRQGAMFAFETLTITLKTLYEPYIPDILPHLLAGFGDGSTDVREATEDASKAIMQTVSGHCVKMILPTLLGGLDEKQWRTKKGAIELLGAMAYCAPRQLSMSLPTVIPRLSEVLTDSHTQVRTSANKSLKQFGEVISNPEIKDLVPILLKALIDPNTKTPAALKGLLETSFVHYIDSPSLALLVPIIDRGLKERSASVQQNAARIVGNLAGLTDSKDFVPYLNKLIPMVRVVLVSPVPEARAVAAKALGTLVERLGEVHFVDLVPSLLQVLRSDATGVDRQGAAQGLAEVLAGLGMERMENLLPEIINSASSARAYVREGHISLLIYLPATFGHRFAPHLGRIIPPILGGIADETESVREASMRAGRMIIANYSSKAVDLLLPHLEQGLFDESWRIRMSSLQLIADLLFRLSGISGKNEVEQEEADEGAEASVVNNSVQKALVEALGQERRDRILASIYIVRQDPNIPVRQSAIHTWKALVHNTPRTAREVLPTMLDILIKSLASNGEENREMAARTLGELVKKLGEKILRETIPILRMRGATADDAKTRSGVCYAVTEILANSTKTQLEDHEDAIIAVVRHALVDESQMVRHAAAQAFDATQQYIGPRAIDETIPTLLEALSDTSGGTSETALAALREVMRARADVVFPVLVPTLVAQPITSFNARALAVLVKVAGSALNRRLSSVLTALSKAVQTEKDEAIVSDLESAVDAIFGSIADVDGLHQTMIQLLGWAGSNISPQQRVAGCRFFKTFCEVKKPSLDLSDYMVDWIRKLVTLFDDPVGEVVDAAWLALEACLKTVSKEEMEGLVVPLRRTLEGVGAPGKNLPGLCRPKGAGPLVPVFLAGLMNGTAEQRQYGALGLSDIVERTSADAIKPFVTSMIGPLIRLCGDRHPPPVKAAILTSLDAMVRRIPALVRPFYPQLQRSYQKAVSDASSATVRSRAGIALGSLMALQARVDPVILELVQGARAGAGEPHPAAGVGAAGAAAAAATGASADASEIADSFAHALAHVLANAPAKNVGQASRDAVFGLLEDAFEASASDDLKETYKLGLAEVVGSLVKLDAELARRALTVYVLEGRGFDAALQSQSIRACLERDAVALHAVGVADEVVKAVAGWIGDASSISRPAKESRELIKESEAWREEARNADWI